KSKPHAAAAEAVSAPAIVAPLVETNGAETNGHTNGHQKNGSSAEHGHDNTTQAIVKGGAGGSRSYPPQATGRPRKGKGLKFPRRFTVAGEDPFETVEWERRTASITGEDGKVVFEQKDCEIPKSWSQLATNVVVSKYFRGPMNTPRRETSVRQVIGRVADTIHGWGVAGGYFA